MQSLIKTALSLDFLRLLPLSLLSCFAARSLAISFTLVHLLLVMAEVLMALYLLFDHHSKSAWAISLFLHLYEALFWCIVLREEQFWLANGIVFPFPPFLMVCLAGYVLYQYYGYEKTRKFHSAV